MVTVYCNKNTHTLGLHVFKFIFLYIFHSHNPSDRTVALGSNQPLNEMNIRNTLWGVNAAVAWG